MMQLQNEKQKNSFYRLQHKYYFYVLNFSEIISLEIKNFRARLGKKSGQKQYFLWGNYELPVFYRIFARGEEKTQEKIFLRSFSAFFETFPFNLEEDLPAEKITLACDAKYNVSITPLFLTFFPLLAKFGYPPFKVSVDVLCDVHPWQHNTPIEAGDDRLALYRKTQKKQTVEEKKTMEERRVKDEGEKEAGAERAAAEIEKKAVNGREGTREKRFLKTAGKDSFYLEKLLQMAGGELPAAVSWQKQDAAKEGMFAASSPVNVPYEEQVVRSGILAKNDKDEAERDFLVREREKGIKTKIPVSDPQYYQAQRSFYEQYFPEIPEKGPPPFF